jgi:hypothetical protein
MKRPTLNFCSSRRGVNVVRRKRNDEIAAAVRRNRSGSGKSKRGAF